MRAAVARHRRVRGWRAATPGAQNVEQRKGYRQLSWQVAPARGMIRESVASADVYRSLSQPSDFSSRKYRLRSKLDSSRGRTALAALMRALQDGGNRQTRAVLSFELVTTRSPSEEKAADNSPDSCPDNLTISTPVAATQTLAVRSADALIRSLPSRE